MTAVLYLAFLLSGAAGLIYETTWSRYLGLLVGHSAYAQTIVLVVFLGGMAAGALATGRRSERVRRPWLVYAGVEAIVGLLGFAFHPIYEVVSGAAYGSIFPALEGGAALLVVKWTIAAALILPQSVLLGTTFPLMSAEVLRRFPEAPGRVLSMLYFTNGLGGAAGVLAGGFWLLPRGGLPGSLAAAAALNIGVAILVASYAVVMREASPESRWTPRRRAATPPAERAVPTPIRATQAIGGKRELRGMLLAVSFGTAVASFIYEIAWIRMLSLVLGSATHSFELMLSAFILGLALGALWARRHIDGFVNPIAALGLVQWAMGALAMATLTLYLASFDWTAALLSALDLTNEGYTLFSIARYGISLAIMLPATFCAGITLPLITRMLIDSGEGERAVGAVYGANTLGSILGVVLAALVLMPLIGLKALLITGALIDMALGIWLLAVARWGLSSRRTLVLASVAVTLALVAVVDWGARFDRKLLTSGVFRLRQVYTQGRDILFYRDGRTATVSAAREYEATLLLATNGKVDASLPTEWLVPRDSGAPLRVLSRDVGTQLLLSLLTLAHAPRAREMAVIGHGSGMSSHTLLGSPHAERVTTIEIEPAMIDGSRVFHPANARSFSDPRSRFAIDDARAWFAGGGRRFDLILSEPSNPWVSGVSGLFTTEFYAQVAAKLADGGVFGQWIHLYEIDDSLVLSVLAALHPHFGAYQIFYTAPNDVIVVATRGDSLPAPDWSVVSFPGIAADLADVVPITAETFEALRVAGRRTFGPLLDLGEETANSDFNPVLDLGAERGRYLSRTAYGFTTMHSYRFDPFAAIEGHRLPLAIARESATPDIPPNRAAVLSARLRSADAVRGPADESADLTSMRYRRETHDAMVASGRAPADWKLWFRTLIQVESELHGPADGHADEEFHAALKRYLARAGAPPGAVAAADFMQALAAWDWATAARTADPLIEASLRNETWVHNDMLRDGAVVAKLMVGDVAGARRAFERLTPGPREERDLRARLLDAQIVTAARRGSTTDSTAR